MAPGGPGGKADWLPANKSGFGTSRSTSSKVWFTLEGGRLSEVYYPRLDTPSVRSLDFMITDGRSFAARAQDTANSTTHLIGPDQGKRDNKGNPNSLTYQIINTDTAKRWRLTTSFVTDPSQSTLLVDVEFISLDGRPYQVYAVYQPQLGNPAVGVPLNQSGITEGNALLSSDASMQFASALIASPAFTETSNGYLGTSDGVTDLSQNFCLTTHYSSSPAGTVVQTGRLPLTGLADSQHVTLALGFAAGESTALDTANASLKVGLIEFRTNTPMGGIGTCARCAILLPAWRLRINASCMRFQQWCSLPVKIRPTGVPLSPRRRCRGRLALV